MNGKIGAYKDKVGLPSFVSQVIFVAWSALCAIVLVAMVGHASLYHDDRDAAAGKKWRDEAQVERTSAVFFSLLCPSATWIGVALPLGIVALATMRKKP